MKADKKIKFSSSAINNDSMIFKFIDKKDTTLECVIKHYWETSSINDLSEDTFEYQNIKRLIANFSSKGMKNRYDI